MTDSYSKRKWAGPTPQELRQIDPPQRAVGGGNRCDAKKYHGSWGWSINSWHTQRLLEEDAQKLGLTPRGLKVAGVELLFLEDRARRQIGPVFSDPENALRWVVYELGQRGYTPTAERWPENRKNGAWVPVPRSKWPLWFGWLRPVVPPRNSIV